MQRVPLCFWLLPTAVVTNEDKLVEGIDDVVKLKELYINTEDHVSLINEGLSVLNEQVMRIIEVFFMQSVKKKIDYLI